LKSASPTIFDEAYYQRFYFDKKTSVVDPEHMERLGNFVCSYLQVPARARAKRAGCRLRHRPVEEHRRGAALSLTPATTAWSSAPTCASASAGNSGSVVDYRGQHAV
jgi:hypothetical protein